MVAGTGITHTEKSPDHIGEKLATYMAPSFCWHYRKKKKTLILIFFTFS